MTLLAYGQTYMFLSVCFSDVISLWSDIHECDWYIDLCIYEYLLEASQISGRRKRDISPLDRTKRSLMDFFNVIWSKGAQILEDVTANLSTPSIIIEVS